MVSLYKPIAHATHVVGSILEYPAKQRQSAMFVLSTFSVNVLSGQVIQEPLPTKFLYVPSSQEEQPKPETPRPHTQSEISSLPSRLVESAPLHGVQIDADEYFMEYVPLGHRKQASPLKRFPYPG